MSTTVSSSSTHPTAVDEEEEGQQLARLRHIHAFRQRYPYSLYAPRHRPSSLKAKLAAEEEKAEGEDGDRKINGHTVSTCVVGWL